MQNFQRLKIEGDTGLVSRQGIVAKTFFHQFFHKDGVVEEPSILLRVGGKQISLKLYSSSKIKEPMSLGLSLQDMKQLGLSQGKYGLVWDHLQNQLRIGPVVGIMSEVRKSESRPFSKQTVFFKQLLQEAEKCGVLAYIFSPSAVQENKNWLNGYIFKKNHWVMRRMPFPDVVYPRHSGYSNYALNIRKTMKNMGAIFINPPLIGKWKTTCWLQRYTNMKKYLPETYKIEHFYQVDEMLEKWPAVFLKPITGAQGRDIIRVEHGKVEYYFQYQMNKKMYHGNAKNIHELQMKLQKVMKNQLYIVQQQIELLRVNGCVADVRIVVQKNQWNQWQVTGKAFRVGHKRSITSNISAGGYAQAVPEVLHGMFPGPQAKRIEQAIDQLALQAAQYLEEGIGATGEFGVDIGVDKYGEVWFIEANLKPGRQIFSLLGDIDGRQRSVRGPLLYARWLAGFENDRKKGAEVDGEP